VDSKLLKAAMNNVARGQIKSLTQKLDKCPDLVRWSTDGVYGTLLHRAVSCGKADIVSLLLERGADPNAIDSKYKLLTPFHFAALERQRAIVDLLLDAGADINKPDLGGDAALSMLLHYPLRDEDAKRNCHDLFLHLLDKGAEIKAPHRIVTFAAEHGLLRVMERVLGDKITEAPPKSEPTYSTSSREVNTYSPLYYAMKHGHPDAFELLLRHGAHWEDNGIAGRNALVLALQGDNWQAAKMLLEAGVSSDHRYYAEPSLLPLPSVSAKELTQRLYEGTKNNVYFDRGYYPYQPEAHEFIAALAAELENFPSELWPLLLLGATGFRFVARFLEKFVMAHVSNPDNAQRAKLQNLSEPIDEEAEPDFADVAEMQDSFVRDTAESGTVAETVANNLAALLAQTQAAMAKLDPRIPLLFNDGLASEKIESLWNKKFSQPIPDDLATLYAWHNGTNAKAEEMFKGYTFSTLEDALVRMDGLASLFPFYHFHLMENIFGCWLQFDTRPDWHGMVCDVDREIPDAIDVYPNLAAYFAAFAECFQNGSFRIVSEDGDDHIIGYGEAINATFARYRYRSAGEKLPEIPSACDEEGIGDSDWKIALD